jgi:hypothetical protein
LMGDFGPDPLEDLPDDPEEAFLLLEERFQEERDLRLRSRGKDDDLTLNKYISQVLGAIAALGLEEFKSEMPPTYADGGYVNYLEFDKHVTQYCTMLRVRRSLRRQGYSVQFDDVAKRKIHHHLDQVLEIFNKLEVEDTKREKLISRLSDLQSEVNQRRTRFDRFAALSIEVSSVIGDVIDKTKVLDLLDAVARVFWGAQTERQKQLPAPKQPKTIEPPKPKIETRAPPDMDDDIPF